MALPTELKVRFGSDTAALGYRREYQRVNPNFACFVNADDEDIATKEHRAYNPHTDYDGVLGYSLDAQGWGAGFIAESTLRRWWVLMDGSEIPLVDPADYPPTPVRPIPPTAEEEAAEAKSMQEALEEDMMNALIALTNPTAEDLAMAELAWAHIIVYNNNIAHDRFHTWENGLRKTLAEKYGEGAEAYISRVMMDTIEDGGTTGKKYGGHSGSSFGYVVGNVVMRIKQFREEFGVTFPRGISWQVRHGADPEDGHERFFLDPVFPSTVQNRQ